MKFISTKMANCPKCKQYVKQVLFDYVNGIYRCTKCNNLHI